MTDEDVRAIVKKRIADKGQNAWCREHDLHSAHVSEFMTGKRLASASLLAALNLERRIVRIRALKP